MAYTITRTEYGAALHDASCDMWLDLTISAEAYAMGCCRANYPVPAILPKHTRLMHLGFVSAENGFSIEAVFNQYIRL